MNPRGNIFLAINTKLKVWALHHLHRRSHGKIRLAKRILAGQPISAEEMYKVML